MHNIFELLGVPPGIIEVERIEIQAAGAGEVRIYCFYSLNETEEMKPFQILCQQCKDVSWENVLPEESWWLMDDDRAGLVDGSLGVDEQGAFISLLTGKFLFTAHAQARIEKNW